MLCSWLWTLSLNFEFFLYGNYGHKLSWSKAVLGCLSWSERFPWSEGFSSSYFHVWYLLQLLFLHTAIWALLVLESTTLRFTRTSSLTLSCFSLCPSPIFWPSHWHCIVWLQFLVMLQGVCHVCAIRFGNWCICSRLGCYGCLSPELR